MEFYEVVRSRRSIRSYGPDAVEDQKLERILEAARLAPSAANRQPLVFYVIRDPRLRGDLRRAYGQQWFTSAPVIVCVCCRPDEAWRRGDGKNYADVDAAIAMEHLVLAAAAEGLGTCWIGAFKPQPLREILGIPDELEPVALTPLGYPAERPSATPRKSLDELVRYL